MSDENRIEPGTELTLSRRDLLKRAAFTGAGLGLGLGPDHSDSPDRAPIGGAGLERPPEIAESMIGVPFERHEVVRIAIVGTGLRGRSVLNELLGIDGVRVVALCDVVPEKAERARTMVQRSGRQGEDPALYTRGERAFEELCRRDDIDLVYTATPWEWHVPVALAAMRSGKHAAVEVPVATSIDDCWRLVNESERRRRHCIMMENVCYSYNELLMVNAVHAGLLGDIKHGECAYNHDLRAILFENRDEGLWRRAPHASRNGNLYPTHGLGPLAFYMDINRGDRFDYMVSMSSPEFGLTQWREAKEPRESEKWRERYRCGDVNTSLIKTALGRTIMLQHDVVSPRPYDRINLIQGSKGIFRDYPARIYVDGQPGGHAFTNLDSHRAEFEHVLWRKHGDAARSGGHGGMDYIMALRLVQCMREGLVPDMDVYDSCSWSAPGPLSEESVRKGSAPVKFPDFSRGGWRDKRALFSGA